MTLNQFKARFPDVYSKYASTSYALQKQKPLLNRIREFLYSQGIEIILTPDEDSLYYFPTIKFTDNRPEKRFDEYKVKPMQKALNYGVESALAYLETGFYN